MLQIIVIGGSLGGLMAGLALKRLGHAVTIFERTPAEHLLSQGAGIVVGTETQQFFDRHDHTNTPLAVISPFRHYLDKEGKEITRSNYAQPMTSWDLVYFILRANFDGLKSPYIPDPPQDSAPGVYKDGHKISSLELSEDDSEVIVQYTDTTGDLHSATADMVVCANGAGGSLLPNVRKYAGYIAWRGTVPEQQLSPSTQESLVDKFTFFHSKHLQILSYLIPGDNGSIKKGKRKMNWVWYCNLPEGSEELTETMTDTEGVLHRFKIPHGKIRADVWERQLQKARHRLPPPFTELVSKTDTPFIQAITDVLSPQVQFFNGRVVLVGDAVAGLRPHTAASTSQAAGHVLLLERLMDESGGLMLDDQVKMYEEYALVYGRELSRHGIEMGNRSQFGEHPMQR